MPHKKITPLYAHHDSLHRARSFLSDQTVEEDDDDDMDEKENLNIVSIKPSKTEATRNPGLYFLDPRETAFISGAGIAGLAAAMELLAKGFKVVIAEKRSVFDRFNVINLDVETQRFLKKFNLLDEFEASVAAKLSVHKLVHYGKDGFELLNSSDVSKLTPSNLSFEPESFDQLFNQDGIYSVKIKDLQNFLAQKVLEAGGHIFGNVATKFIRTEQAEGAAGVSEVQIKGNDSIFDPMLVQPALVFVAEGAHSTTATLLGMGTHEVINECTGENWIFGNVKYFGAENFVVSMIDTSTGSLQIANIIFNSKLQEANIAVTSSPSISPTAIQERILMIAKRVFALEKIDSIPELINCVKRPVHIKNQQLNNYSQGNVYFIGNTAATGSPLAGLGGTLCLTLVLYAIEQLLKNRAQQPDTMHFAFNNYYEACALRWFAKSEGVKKKCRKVATSQNTIN